MCEGPWDSDCDTVCWQAVAVKRVQCPKRRLMQAIPGCVCELSWTSSSTCINVKYSMRLLFDPITTVQCQKLSSASVWHAISHLMLYQASNASRVFTCNLQCNTCVKDATLLLHGKCSLLSDLNSWILRFIASQLLPAGRVANQFIWDWGQRNLCAHLPRVCRFW